MTHMIRILLIPADSDRAIEVRTIGSNGDSVLTALQELVGGFITPVPLLSGTLYVNEQSSLGRLPTNWRATDLWREEVPGKSLAGELSGDAVLVGALTADGYDTDVAERYRERLLPL